jgi:protoheme IX farnesyltransferase
MDASIISKLRTDATVEEYFSLLKPRVMGLVIFTALCGYILSPFSIHPFLAFVGLLAIATGAGASGCLNQWYEARTDALMDRTRHRAVSSGAIPADAALSLGIILSILSIIVLQITFGLMQCLLLAFTIFYYAFVYTVCLKPYTDQNIVWGGVSGALPPVIGYSLGGTIDLYAGILFFIIFFWTPAHFWALSLTLKEDYNKAHIPILPNTKGDAYTKKQILLYATLTALISFLPLFLRHSPLILWGIFIILNVIWLKKCIHLYNETLPQPLKVFFFSMVYLFSIFLLLSIFH